MQMRSPKSTFAPVFKRLRQKWGVSGGRLVLILCTFAVGGSLCGYAGRKLLGLTGLEKGVWWVVAYIALITVLWPLAVLLVSIPFGQTRFFMAYLRRMGRHFRGRQSYKEPTSTTRPDAEKQAPFPQEDSSVQ